MTAALTVVAAVIGIGSQLGGWQTIGWQTPAQHDADFVVAVEELKEFRDEWKCDEYDEELLELREKLSVAQTEAEKIELQHQIEKLKTKMEKLDCSRFEDFG